MNEPKKYPCNALSCDFKGTKTELTEHADEYAHPLCRCCPRSLTQADRIVCEKCVEQTRNSLTALTDTFEYAPSVIEASGYRTAAIPGGDLLTMTVDGNAAGLIPYKPTRDPRPQVTYTEIPGQTETITYWRYSAHKDCTETVFPHQHTMTHSRTHKPYETKPAGDGREHYADHWTSDPTAVIAALDVNARAWRHTFGQPPADAPATVQNCVEYLTRWLYHAAAYHDEFDEFVTEIRTLKSRYCHSAGVVDDPIRAPAACFDCGGTLIKPYRPPAALQRHPDGTRRGHDFEGLPDDYECRSCAGIYDTASYYLAVRAALEAQAELAG